MCTRTEYGYVTHSRLEYHEKRKEGNRRSAWKVECEKSQNANAPIDVTVSSPAWPTSDASRNTRRVRALRACSLRVPPVLLWCARAVSGVTSRLVEVLLFFAHREYLPSRADRSGSARHVSRTMNITPIRDLFRFNAILRLL